MEWSSGRKMEVQNEGRHWLVCPADLILSDGDCVKGLESHNGEDLEGSYCFLGEGNRT